VDFDLRAHTILLAVGGSRAYGIHKAGSDVDVKGVAIPPAPYLHGYLQRFEQADKASHMGQFLDDLTEEERQISCTTKLEGSIYEIRKFIGLAVDCNPNILDVLFCRDAEVRLATPLGERLRAARAMFLSAKARHTFSGYAASQLRRIQGHRQWLLSPPDHKPTRAEFGLPEHTLIPADQLAAAAAAVRKQMDRWELDLSGLPDAEILHVQDRIASVVTEMTTALGLHSSDDTRWLAAARTIGLDDNLVLVMQREREYEAAARHYKQYEEWKRNRNPARAELEAKYGYDAKHGAHLVRLLRMGKEILLTGKVNVWRGPDGGPGDAEELLAIRQGAWSYDQLVGWAEQQDQELEQIYRDRKYVVPKAPERERIDTLCVELVEEALAGRS
jgi:predicted nucleotidyltransferase